MFVPVEYWAQKTVSPMDGRDGWAVVDAHYHSVAEVTEFLWVLRHGRGRSDGTARAYAGRLALYLTWATEAGVEWRRPSPVELTGFMGWLVRTPSRKYRQGRNRRQAVPMNRPQPGSARAPQTVNGILTVVVELLRYLGAYEVIDEVVAGRLSQPRRLRLLPGEGWGEGATRTVDARVLRQRSAPPAPMTLTVDQQEALRSACRNHRDRFLVEVFAGTGLRVGEACGLRLEDLHFLPSSELLGCRVPGAHLHVVRREGGDNGAVAKSPCARSVPVGARVAAAYSAYRLERDRVPEATVSDFVFVNLYRPPLGRGLTPHGVEELFARLSAKVGFQARPHMLRHSFASAIAERTRDPVMVKELLGHATVTSTDVYLHPRWAELRAAVTSLSQEDR